MTEINLFTFMSFLSIFGNKFNDIIFSDKLSLSLLLSHCSEKMNVFWESKSFKEELFCLIVKYDLMWR